MGTPSCDALLQPAVGGTNGTCHAAWSGQRPPWARGTVSGRPYSWCCEAGAGSASMVDQWAPLSQRTPGSRVRVRRPRHLRPLPLVGSIGRMAREKATITVDREKLAEARTRLGAPSASAAIDVALTELLRRHRLRDDLKAYAAAPPTVEEAAPALVPPDWGDLADDTDWDLEWPEDQ